MRVAVGDKGIDRGRVAREFRREVAVGACAIALLDCEQVVMNDTAGRRIGQIALWRACEGQGERHHHKHHDASDDREQEAVSRFHRSHILAYS